MPYASPCDAPPTRPPRHRGPTARAACRWKGPVLVFLFALTIRLAIILVTPSGFPADMRGWMETTKHVVEDGIQAAYSPPSPGNLYPPAFFYPLWLTGQVYRLCCSPQLELNTRSFDILLRLAAALCDAAIAAMLTLIPLAWSSPRVAVLSGLIYAVNPAILVDTAWMSQIGDPFYMLLVLLSFHSILAAHYAPGSVSMMLAVLCKPQALALAPLAAFLAVRRASTRQLIYGFLSAVAACFIVLSPFLISGRIRDLLHAANRMLTAYPFLHVRAYNAWYLLSGGRDPDEGTLPLDTQSLLGFLTYEQIGILAFLCLLLLTIHWLIGRAAPECIMAAAALTALGFYIVCTRMQVNYSIPALVLLSAISVAPGGRYRLILTISSVAAVSDWLLSTELSSAADNHLGAWAPALRDATALGYLLAFLLLALAVRATTSASPRKEPDIRADSHRLQCLAVVTGLTLVSAGLCMPLLRTTFGLQLLTLESRSLLLPGLLLLALALALRTPTRWWTGAVP